MKATQCNALFSPPQVQAHTTLADNFDTIHDRSTYHAVKYNERAAKFGVRHKDVIPLWIADMDFQTAQPIIDALHQMVSHGIYGYTTRPKDYFQSFINWQQRRHQWTVDVGLLSFCVGIVPALAALAQQLSDKNDKVLIISPVYSEFYDINEDNQRQVIECPMQNINGDYALDFEKFEQQLQQQPKFLVFCNPHNPVGKVWTREELTTIGELCVQYGVVVISDEIHADLTLWGNTHIPMASVSEAIAANTITCTSTGKAFNTAGLQSATLVFNNRQQKRTFDQFWRRLEVHRNNPFNLVATIAAYEYGENYLKQLIQYLQDNILFVHDFIKQYIPQIKANIPQATYLIWLDCRQLGFTQQTELEQFMLEKAGLGLNSGAAYQKNLNGYMRLNAACPRSVLKQAMQQLKAAVDDMVESS